MCLERQRITFTARRQANTRIHRKIKSVINLNKFWEELEEMYRDRTSSEVLPVKVETSAEQLENDINENIERLQRMSPPQAFLQEDQAGL